MKKFAFDPTLSAQQTFRFVTDDGTAVVLLIRWNTRSQAWYMDVTQNLASGVQSTFSGVKLVPSFPILRQVKNLFTFPGDFIVFPTSSAVQANPIGYYDLGSNWYLCWLNDSEMAAWKAQNGLR